MAELVEPRAVLRALGFPDDGTISPVGGGMSATGRYRVRRPDGTDLLLRTFPEFAPDWVAREAAAQQTAFAAGLPVARIHRFDTVGDRSVPVIVADWSSGLTLMEMIRSGPTVTPDRANRLGQRSGVVLASLHAAPPPDLLLDDPGALRRRWLPDLPDWLVRAVDGPDAASRLVHFDYHPGNLLFSGDEVSAVIDWTNALVGDPRLDLGRSYACLQFGALLDPDIRELADGFWRGLVTGYGSSALTLDELAPFFAVGMTTLIDDRHRDRDASADQQAAVAALEIERDAWIGMSERDHKQYMTGDSRR